MKKILTLVIYFFPSLSMVACSNGGGNPNYTKPTPEIVTANTSYNTTGNEGKYEMIQDVIEFGLTINDTYYPIPSALKQLLDNGWSISTQTPYFLLPLASEDYYEARANLSLSDDGEGIRAGGSIIRLLEKDGELLEVTIANQADSEKDGKFQKITDGIIESITVFYNDMQTSIKLNDIELSSLSRETLLASYPGSDGWTHIPTNYSNHPEFGISTEYCITRHLDNCNRSISIYFNLENTAFGIIVENEMPLKFYSK